MDRLYLGVNFNIDTIVMGLVDTKGQIRNKRVKPIAIRHQQDSVSALEASITGYLADWEGAPPAAIGISLPGQIHREKGLWLNSILAMISTPVKLVELLQGCVSIPIFIDNDIHAATYAENYFGIGRITKNFILVNIDNGISMGIVSEGRPVSGANNASGEIGHMSVEYNGEPCECGHRGCLERIASESALVKQVVKALPLYPESRLKAYEMMGLLSSNEIFSEAQQGDPLARKVVDRALRAVGIGVVNLINILNPEYIIFTGKVIENRWFFDRVHDYLYENGYIATLNGIQGVSYSYLSKDDLEICGSASLCWAGE